MTPREMALTLARALDSKKGKNIRVLEINNVTTLADYFVLCTGTSAPQLKALADAGEKAMKEAGILPHHIEGHRGGTWILQDYGDVVVHLFDTEARAFYDLDRLWQDAVEVTWLPFSSRKAELGGPPAFPHPFCNPFDFEKQEV